MKFIIKTSIVRIKDPIIEPAIRLFFLFIERLKGTKTPLQDNILKPEYINAEKSQFFLQQFMFFKLDIFRFL